MTGITKRDVIEAVGNNYSSLEMFAVRDMTRNAIFEISQNIEPGMLEEEAVEVAKNILETRGLLRGWHGVFVRFGINTVKTFGAPSESNIVLGENDIFFIDIGPIWKDWEGDGGKTFITGQDMDKMRCAADSEAIFHEVRQHWLTTGCTGVELYQFARDATERRGWVLNMDLDGHRISDFPHSAVYGGAMADIDFSPSSQLWVLEIHIRNQTNTFGAFFEDMLLEDEYFRDLKNSGSAF